jgi:DNA-binding transcriptional regulator YdaS (Cro superfamily)
MNQITPADRRRLADQVGVNEQYLYQCLSGLRDMNPGKARRIEGETNGALHRRMLCQKTWREIWPELAETATAVDGEGA